MADRKLSQLPALTGANTASGDLLYIVDVSEPLAADQSKKITLTEFQSAPISAGTANGLLYLNASKVPTSGAGLTYDGTDLTVVGAVNAGSVNTTTLDLTNLEVTNIKAKDGTAAATIADATGKITVSTELAVDNLNLSGNTIASTDTDGNIVLAPNGNGDVQLDADTVRIGDANSNALITTNGTGDLVLNTNSGTNSGFITIEDGVNGNIIIAPNGTGQVQITNAALDLTTIEVTNIKAKDGTAAMTLADSTGVTTFAANPILNAGTANGVPYLNGSKVLTTGSALTFDGTNLATTGSLGVGAAADATHRAYIFASGNGIARFGNGTTDVNMTGVSGVFGTNVAQFGGQLAWSLVGSEQMRLTSTGLGIGTSSPATKLQIVSDTPIRLNNAASTSQADLSFADSGATLKVENFFGTGSAITFGTNANGAGVLERMRLDSSGNLGLGVTPSAWWSLFKAFQFGTVGSVSSGSGVTNVGHNYFFDGTNVRYLTTDNASYYQQTGGQHRFFTAPSGTAGNAITFSQAMTLDASGNLGVGVTSPSVRLHIDSGATDEVIRINSTNNPYLGIYRSGVLSAYLQAASGGMYVWNSANTELLFGTNNTERARITSGGTFQTSLDASIYGVTVGRGAGAVSTNTAVGASALSSNSTGAFNSAFGVSALAANTTNSNTAFGYLAAAATTTGTGVVAVGRLALNSNTTGNYHTAVGEAALYSNTTGTQNTAVGDTSLYSNTTGNYNTAVGMYSLQANTTASDNTAVGYQAGYSNTTGINVNAFGQTAAYSNTTGEITAIGSSSLYSNTTGTLNTAVGTASLYANTTGGSNVAVGRDALRLNTTASNNTAVGYQAGYSNTTGAAVTAIGKSALYASTGSNNTAVGTNAGVAVTSGAQNTLIGSSAGGGLTTGSFNTFIGMNSVGNGGSGELVTTGSKNTIIGGYSGNQGGLDIRTANNYIVLSDGDGNPRWINDGTDNWGSGVDPSNWVSGFRAIELTNAVALWSQDSTPSAWLTVNAYYDSSWKYKTSAAFSGYNQSGGYHTWYSDGSGTANATFTPTQVLATVQGSSLALQGANPQTGTGITFPATQSASSNANTLDDYEEGTWTPAVRGALTAGTYELATAEGSYVKIGKQVTLTCRIVFAAAITGGGTGYLQITGAPAFNNAAVAYGAVSQSGLDMTTNYTWLTASFILTSGTTTLYLDENGDNVNSSDFPISGVSANDSIRFSITYIASA